MTHIVYFNAKFTKKTFAACRDLDNDNDVVSSSVAVGKAVVTPEKRLRVPTKEQQQTTELDKRAFPEGNISHDEDRPILAMRHTGVTG